MGRALFSRILLSLVGFLSVLIVILAFSKNVDRIKRAKNAVYTAKRENNTKVKVRHKAQDEDFEQKLIFIGGMPRTGTTLMRAMLESHPDIRCGPETHVIPGILSLEHKWKGSTHEVIRLVEAGVLPHALDAAIAKFILAIIVHHGPPAKNYCNKDPFVLTHTEYVHQLFPNAKFILMLRDGRAVTHSIVTNKIVVGGFNIKSYRDVLYKWSLETQHMFKECKNVGADVCLQVHYEQLVLRPIENTKKIFKFLGIPWRKEVLHHEQYLNETKLSTFESASEDVQKALNLDDLTRWCGHLPADVERDAGLLAPMLQILGYDPRDQHPKYGEPDDFMLGKLEI